MRLPPSQRECPALMEPRPAVKAKGTTEPGPRALHREVQSTLRLCLKFKETLSSFLPTVLSPVLFIPEILTGQNYGDFSHVIAFG